MGKEKPKLSIPQRSGKVVFSLPGKPLPPLSGPKANYIRQGHPVPGQSEQTVSAQTCWLPYKIHLLSYKTAWQLDFLHKLFFLPTDGPVGWFHRTLTSSRTVRKGLTATLAQLWPLPYVGAVPAGSPGDGGSSHHSQCHYLNTGILCLIVPPQNLGTPRGPQRYLFFLYHMAHSHHTQGNFSASTNVSERDIPPKSTLHRYQERAIAAGPQLVGHRLTGNTFREVNIKHPDLHIDLQYWAASLLHQKTWSIQEAQHWEAGGGGAEGTAPHCCLQHLETSAGARMSRLARIGGQ